MRNPAAILQQEAGVGEGHIAFWMEYLASQGIFDCTRFHDAATPQGIEYLLRVLGERFEVYRRS
jgi:hypothetical protein